MTEKIIFLSIDRIHHQDLEHVYGCSYALYPTPDLATLYNAAVLKKNGHQVSLFRLSGKNDIKKIPKATIYFIHSVILSEKYDLLLAKILQKRKVFFFGPNPTLAPQRYLKNKNHFVLRGETEHIIGKAVLDPWKCQGVSYYKNKIVHNPTAGIIENLDEIPLPLRSVDQCDYFNPKLSFRKYTAVMASRGCPNRCYFCVPNSISWAREIEWKRNFKGKPPVCLRSAKNIVLELKSLKKDRYREFSFIDDQFIFGKDRTLEILEGIKELKYKFGLLARADRLLDREIVKALADAGCVYVDIGVESFDQEVLDDIKKDISLSIIFQAIENLSYFGIEPKLNIVFGLSPKENKEKIEKTIDKTLNLPVSSCMFSLATPYPGTKFAKIARQNKWVSSKKISPLKESPISYPHLKAEKLNSLVKMANRRFYLRPKIIWRQLQKIKSIGSLRKSSYFFFKLLKNLRW